MILIIDRNLDKFPFLRKVIESNGHDTEYAANTPQDVLNLILKKTFSLIIMNFDKLNVEEREIIDILKNHNNLKNIPIIFIIPNEINNQILFKDFHDGTVDYITTPININQLLLKIKIFHRMYEYTQEIRKADHKLKQEVIYRKQAQSELRERIQYLHTILNSLPQITFKADYNGAITFVNEKWYEYSHSPMVFPKQYGHCTSIQQKFKACRLSKKSLECEVRLKHLETGNYRYHLLRIRPVIENEEVLKWVGTFTDIEDQKQVENKKEEFLSIASHELKTPLTSIKGYVQLLARLSNSIDNKAFRSLIDKTFNQVLSLEVLISDLLDLTKINNGKFEMKFQYFDLESLIIETISTFNQMNSLLGITIVKEGIEIKGQVYADKFKIEQVLINYLSNATKYAPESKKIIVRTSCSEESIKVEVIDFGIGISEDNISNLFDKFYRVEDNTLNYQGLGIGLYICSQIITQHKGTYGLSSIYGKGSTFYFTLPIAESNVC